MLDYAEVSDSALSPLYHRLAVTPAVAIATKLLEGVFE